MNIWQLLNWNERTIVSHANNQITPCLNDYEKFNQGYFWNVLLLENPMSHTIMLLASIVVPFRVRKKLFSSKQLLLLKCNCTYRMFTRKRLDGRKWWITLIFPIENFRNLFSSMGRISTQRNLFKFVSITSSMCNVNGKFT